MMLALQILVLIMSVVVHEVAHGYMASYLGDDTARYQGRLTLNPLEHLDPVGSFIIPLISFTFGGFIIGWAKPVPYNPYNLRSSRRSEALVAAAGPASNLILALIFWLALGPGNFFTAINVTLAIFNLIPIPPLDGSKILAAIFK